MRVSSPSETDSENGAKAVPETAEKHLSLLNPEFDKGVEKFEGYEIDVPRGIIDLCERVKEMGGTAMLVGGCVRDAVLSKERNVEIKSKDIDIEIYGLAPEAIQEMLERNFDRVKLEGEAFSVFKVKVPGCREYVDVSLPRSEKKVAPGHQGFLINVSPEMSFREAARRRDLTINSLGFDPLEGIVYDAHGGVRDIKEEIINVVDGETFREDALRVWRVAQFASRFGMKVSEETIELCRGIVLGEVKVTGDEIDNLPIERITEEWQKLLGKGVRPSAGMEFAREAGLVEKFYPELYALVGMEQEKGWHPEGDVWTHTLQTVDAAALIANREIAAGTFLDRYDLGIVKEKVKEEGRLARKRESVRLWEAVIREKVPDGKELVLKIRAQAAEEARQERLEEIDKKSRAPGREASPKLRRRLREVEKLRREELRARLLEGEIDRLAGEKILSKEDLREIETKARSKQAAEMAKTRTRVKAERTRDLKLALLLSSLLHDTGKGQKGVTRLTAGGKVASKGHEQAGIALAKSFLGKFSFSEDIKKMVLALVPEHMAPKALKEQGAGKAAITKLAARLETGGATAHLLALLTEADQRGRNPDSGEPLAEDQTGGLDEWRSWFRESTAEVRIARGRPERLLTGETLMEALGDRIADRAGRRRGGLHIGAVTDLVLLEQMKGEIADEESAVRRGVQIYDDLVAALGDPRDGTTREEWQKRRRAVGEKLKKELTQD